MRLDQAVAERFEGLSRRKARELIASGAILVNRRPVRIASRHVNATDEITRVEKAAEIPLIASTDDWLAVNKPAGLPTQPTRDRKEISLEDLLRVKYREIYLVHRLDTPTSGVVLFARTREAAAEFSELFATGAMKKTYVAVVSGEIDREMAIDAAIDGKDALTIVRPRAGGGAGAPLSHVEVEIKTGRTHQIRIHLASIGHEVAGDRRYGGPPAQRLMLHAWKLEHPSVGTLEAPVPW